MVNQFFNDDRWRSNNSKSSPVAAIAGRQIGPVTTQNRMSQRAVTINRARGAGSCIAQVLATGRRRHKHTAQADIIIGWKDEAWRQTKTTTCPARRR